jgi:hypothetical protein
MFELRLASGHSIVAEHVVIASGVHNQPRIPEWALAAACQNAELTDVMRSVRVHSDLKCSHESAGVSILHPYLLHTSQLLQEVQLLTDSDLDPTPSLRDKFAHKQLVIVGGGMTAVQLLLVAVASRCQSVTLVSRRPLQQRQFDIDTAWLTRARPLLMSKYWALSMKERAKFVAHCRGGGSVPVELLDRLYACLRNHPGTAFLRENVQIQSASFNPTGHLAPPWQLTLGNSHSEGCASELCSADLIVLATGTAIDANTEPLFQDLLNTWPETRSSITAGLPCLTPDLRWAPGKFMGMVGILLALCLLLLAGVNVYVCGAWAALQLGPDAGNIAGAVAAARRLYPLLSPLLESTRPTGSLPSYVQGSVSRFMGGDGNLFAALAGDGSDSDCDSE